MMYMNRSLIVLSFFLILASNSLSAQNSGFMGRRLLVTGSFGGTPAFWGPTANNRGLHKPYGSGRSKIGFSTRYELDIDYAISRNTSLTGGISYFKTGLETEMGPNIGDDYLYDFFWHLHVTSLSVGLKRFILRSGGIAPMGTYFGVKGNLSYIKGELLDGVYRINYPSGPYYNINPNIFDASLIVEFGRNVLLSERFFLNTSIRFELSPMGIFTRKDSNQKTLEDGGQKEFKRAALKRNNLHSLVFYQLGVGYLIL